MLVAYIAVVDIKLERGVLKKIANQITIWKEDGVDTRLYLISNPADSDLLPENLQGCTELYFTDNSTGIFRKFQYFINFNSLYKSIHNDIHEKKIELVYFRQHIWFPALGSIIKCHHTILELNSIDSNETSKFNLAVRLLYSYGRKKILHQVDGLVAISHEIHRHVSEFNKPYIISSNGYMPLHDHKSTKLASDRVQLLFVGTSSQYWQGVDKVLHLASLSPRFDYHIVGYTSEDVLREYPEVTFGENVIFYGKLGFEQLDSLYKKINIGIGTMALHRKNMIEASPLKVREYLAHGLPIIYAYDDTDLDTYSHSNYFLKLENVENNIDNNISIITDFIDRNKNVILNQSELEPCTINYKEKVKVGFMKTILKTGNKTKQSY